MKKIILILLAVFLLSGCTNSNSATNPKDSNININNSDDKVNVDTKDGSVKVDDGKVDVSFGGIKVNVDKNGGVSVQGTDDNAKSK